MNNIRTARRMIEHQDDDTLLELLKLSESETTPEGVTVYQMIMAELSRRKNLKIFEKTFVKGIDKV